MLKTNLVLLITAAFVAVSAQTPDSHRAGDTGSASSYVAKPEGNGIKAVVNFSKAPRGVRVKVTAEGLEDGLQYPYHIHIKPVPDSGDCNATAGHLDPFKIKTEGKPYNCNLSNPRGTCELGDLASRYGNITTSKSGRFTTTYIDEMLSFSGESSILGHSVVIHAPNNTRLACANITLDSGATKNEHSREEKSEADSDSKEDTSHDESKHSGVSGLRSAALSTMVVVSASMALFSAAFF